MYSLWLFVDLFVFNVFVDKKMIKRASKGGKEGGASFFHRILRWQSHDLKLIDLDLSDHDRRMEQSCQSKPTVAGHKSVFEKKKQSESSIYVFLEHD